MQQVKSGARKRISMFREKKKILVRTTRVASDPFYYAVGVLFERAPALFSSFSVMIAQKFLDEAIWRFYN
jgi:hypothetical protein